MSGLAYVTLNVLMCPSENDKEGGEWDEEWSCHCPSELAVDKVSELDGLEDGLNVVVWCN
jgi:hypothetical protein